MHARRRSALPGDARSRSSPTRDGRGLVDSAPRANPEIVGVRSSPRPSRGTKVRHVLADNEVVFEAVLIDPVRAHGVEIPTVAVDRAGTAVDETAAPGIDELLTPQKGTVDFRQDRLGAH